MRVVFVLVLLAVACEAGRVAGRMQYAGSRDVESRKYEVARNASVTPAIKDEESIDGDGLTEVLGETIGRAISEEFEGRHRKPFKKYKKYMLPLLLAYKLKFFTLIPLMMGGLIMLAGSTGLAGFFFALFAATMGLKVGPNHR